MSVQDDAYFWDGAREGKLLLRSCAKCGAISHPPKPMCGQCHSLEWTTRQSSGRGTIYSWLESRHPSQPDSSPRIVVLVDLEEGQRIVSGLVDIALKDISVGLPVEVTFQPLDDAIVPMFRPVKGTAK